MVISEIMLLFPSHWAQCPSNCCASLCHSVLMVYGLVLCWHKFLQSCHGHCAMNPARWRIFRFAIRSLFNLVIFQKFAGPHPITKVCTTAYQSGNEGCPDRQNPALLCESNVCWHLASENLLTNANLKHKGHLFSLTCDELCIWSPTGLNALMNLLCMYARNSPTLVGSPLNTCEQRVFQICCWWSHDLSHLYWESSSHGTDSILDMEGDSTRIILIQ